MHQLNINSRQPGPKNGTPAPPEPRVPTVSVVIPVLNRPEVLIRALASVLAQTLRPTETIVVDDGSDPPIKNLLDLSTLDGVTVLRSEINRGAAAARNMAIAVARGDYVAFLDSDDVWHPEKLQAQIGFMQRVGSVVSTTGFWLRRHADERPPELWLPEGPVGVQRLVWGVHLSPGSTLIVRADALRAIGPQDEGLRRLEDWDWLLRAAYRYPIDVLDRPLTTIEESIVMVVDAQDRPLATIDERVLMVGAVSVQRSAMRVLRLHAWRLAKRSPLNLLRLASTVLLESAASKYREGRMLAATAYGLASVVAWPLRNKRFYGRMLAMLMPFKQVAAKPTRARRVVHVISGLGYGGAERALANLLLQERAKEKLAPEQTVISLSSDGVYGPILRRAGVEVVALDAHGIFNLIRSVTRIAHLIRAKQADVVKCWMYHANLVGTVAALLSGRRRLLRLYWGIRCSDMDVSRYSWSLAWARRIGAWLSSLPDLIVVNSFRGAAVHARLGYRMSQFIVFDNGVDTDRFRPDDGYRRRRRRELGLSEDIFVIGVVARVDPMKGYDTLRAALSHCPGVYCVAIGSGTEKLPQSERFRGIGPSDKVEELLPALDALVSPSAFGEGWSNAVAEAMAAGLPVIATDVGDAARIVADTGIIVPPGDVETLANAIREMQHDTERRRALGVAARKRVLERFALEICAARYEQLLVNGVADTNVA
jgi:glycosyltransferase involved in cell wall biosynthesis